MDASVGPAPRSAALGDAPAAKRTTKPVRSTLRTSSTTSKYQALYHTQARGWVEGAGGGHGYMRALPAVTCGGRADPYLGS